MHLNVMPPPRAGMWRALLTADTTTTTAYETIPLTSDPAFSVTVTAGKLVVPVSGMMEVTANILARRTNTQMTASSAQLVHNSTVIETQAESPLPANGGTYLHTFTRTLTVTAGDTLHLEYKRGINAARTLLAESCWLNIQPGI